MSTPAKTVIIGCGEQIGGEFKFFTNHPGAMQRECQISWANKVHDVRGIIWKALLMKLPAVEGINK